MAQGWQENGKRTMQTHTCDWEEKAAAVLCSDSMLAGLVEFLPEILLTLAGVLGISRIVRIADVREEAWNATFLIQNWYQNVFLAVCIVDEKINTYAY